jgi:hypothetical protein
MFYKLIGEVGFAWSVRIVGFTALATLVIPVVVRIVHFAHLSSNACINR